MDAIGVVGVSIGGFLLYASIKGEHPWTLFQQVIGNYSPVSNPTGSAPYTGKMVTTSTPQGPATVGQGASYFGGGALHG